MALEKPMKTDTDANFRHNDKSVDGDEHDCSDRPTASHSFWVVDLGVIAAIDHVIARLDDGKGV